MEELIKIVKSSIELSQDAEDYFLSIAKKRTFSKGSVLIQQGQKVDKVYFVTDGCLRSYCIDKKGKDHTLQFSIKDGWISDYIAIHTHVPAVLTVECLIDSSLIELTTEGTEKLLKLFPEYEPYQRGNLERYMVSLQLRILNQLQLSAAERYDLFLEQFGDVERYAPNYHIASYLGITQESLSRIRVNRAKK